jgi:hypothetical protein
MKLTIEELGIDKFKKASSKSVIKSGPNRGLRLPEKDGRWICCGGYCYEARQSEKAVHSSWVITMLEMGFRCGKSDSDGIVNFYLFKKDR